MDLWQPADAGDSPYSMSSPGNNATATGTSSSSSSAAAPSTAVAARASGRRHAKFFGGYGTEESSNDDDEDEEEDNEMLSRFGIAQGGERESSTALGLDLWSIDEVKPSIGARSALPGSDDEDEIQKTIDQVRRSMMDSSATSQHFAANDDGMDLEDFLGSVIDKLRRDAGRAADLQSVLSANTRLQDSSLPSNADALDTQSLFGSNARSLPSSSRSLLTDPLTRDLNLAAPLNDILSHRPGPGTAGAPVSIAPHQTFPAANMFTSSSGAARNAPSYSQPLSPSAVMSILSGSTPAGLAAAGPFNHTHLAASAYPAEFPQIKREQQALHSASFLQPHASTSSSSRSSSQSGPSLPNSTQPGLATLPALSPQPNVGSFPPSAYQTQSNYTSPESDADGPNTASFQQHSRSTSGSNYDLTAPSGKASSSTSTTRAHTAKNSPPGSVKHSRSTSSLEGMNRMVPLSSMTAYDHSRSSDNISAIASQGQQVPPQAGPSAAPDKHTQQASCESSSLVRAVYREPAASPEAQMVLQEGQCQLVVLGLPDEGARSRVETQVKIGLTLLRSRFIPSAHPAASAPAAHAPRAMSFRDPRGALTAEADAHFEKVGSWRYLCLPTVSSVKRNAKKHHRADIPSEQVLYADIKVVSASHPSKQISVCTNCQQREFKRLQRKTQNRNKPADEVEEAGREDEIGMSDEELAKRKIVLFNCGQYLDFNNGEAIIPTRITCYCRHHKEKYGFK
ncbi:SPT3 Dosage dependent suppressor of Ty-induced promoter mutations-like protein [Cystobasidiomycetes sp. EMM_F5]